MPFSIENDMERSTLKISQINETEKFFMGNNFQLDLTQLRRLFD